MFDQIKLVLPTAAGALAYLFLAYRIDRWLRGPNRAIFRYAVVVASAALFLIGVGRMVPDAERALGVRKAGIALGAVAALFYEQFREGVRRPVAERWKRFIGLTLAVTAICSYYQFFKFQWPKYYHRHDQYHYYLGSKYFTELGYDDLYKCTVIAQDELGTIVEEESGNAVDVTKENRRKERKMRDTGGDNLLVPAAKFLEHPEACTSKFSPERWAAFKEDVKFFRRVSDRAFWEKMQDDHGYNPPPVWMLGGAFFADMHPAGYKIGNWYWAQWLAQVDNVLILGMFAALFWAFGWRVFAIAAVYWGTNAPGDDHFVSGAFLRMDWLFFFVLAACLARKRWYALSGASLVYAGLLRIFPGLAVIGWLTVAGAYVVKHKRMAKHHQRMLLGGVIAAAVLIGGSLKLCGKDVYASFYHHTLEVHDRTPLTNHMGLRALVSYNVGAGPSSGRQKFLADDKLADPFEVWKRVRNERYDRYRPISYAIVALSLAFFVWVVRRVRSMWVALCLGQIFIILMSQLTSYYYSFLIITAPLTRVKRQLEIPFLGLAALSQLVWGALGYWDDRSAAVGAMCLVFCYGAVCAFAKKGSFDGVLAVFGARRAS